MSALFSFRIGDYVTLGGRVAVRDHVSIASKVTWSSEQSKTRNFSNPNIQLLICSVNDNLTFWGMCFLLIVRRSRSWTNEQFFPVVLTMHWTWSNFWPFLLGPLSFHHCLKWKYRTIILRLFLCQRECVRIVVPEPAWKNSHSQLHFDGSNVDL